MTYRWDTIAIAGVGLIGGSIGLAALERQLARRIIGIGRHPQKLEQAQALGAITDFATNLEDGVAEAQLIIICTPVRFIAQQVCQALAVSNGDAIVTDAGSTKQQIIDQVHQQAGEAAERFVGSHPLAGSEKSGAEHAVANLFLNRSVIVTPTSATNKIAQQQTIEFWQQLGSRTHLMTPAEHDQILAATSHLPHLLASVLAAATPDAALPFVSTGWLDTTRVAAGDPELWTQILQQNQTEVRQSLSHFQSVLEQFSQALDQDQWETLAQILALGKTQRDALGS